MLTQAVICTQQLVLLHWMNNLLIQKFILLKGWGGGGGSNYLSGSLISILEKPTLFHLTVWIIIMLLIWKMIWLISMKSHPLICCDILFLLNWIESLTLFILLKLSPRMKRWFVLWSFFPLRMFLIPLNLPYGLV